METKESLSLAEYSPGGSRVSFRTIACHAAGVSTYCS